VLNRNLSKAESSCYWRAMPFSSSSLASRDALPRRYFLIGKHWRTSQLRNASLLARNFSVGWQYRGVRPDSQQESRASQPGQKMVEFHEWHKVLATITVFM
jgi:hypothetical protein